MELAEAERDHSGVLTRAGWITTKMMKKLILSFEAAAAGEAVS
jgi:hypothetical protein